MKTETEFSPCRKYRYTLWRRWPIEDMLIGECSADTNAHQFVQFIGLNPSTADETLDDPTIRRCIGFSKAWGYGAFCMTNLFAIRATDPLVMKAHQRPIGDDNTNMIMETAAAAGIIIAAWGVHGLHIDRQAQVMDALKPWKSKLHHLGLNADGTPKHPLYLKKTLIPIAWKY